MLFQYLTPKYWSGWLLIFLSFLLAYLPWKVQFFLGTNLGKLIYAIGKRKHVTLVNIALCLPHLSPLEQKNLAYQHFMDFSLSIFETFIALWRNTKKIYKNKVSISGLKHITEAKKNNQAILLIGGHFSSLDLCMLLLEKNIKHHYHLDIIYRKSYNSLIEQFLLKRRQKNCHKMLPSSNLRQIITSLKQKNIVWMACDQDISNKKLVFAPFMGVTAATVTSPSKLAKITNACVIPYSCKRISKNGTYQLTLHPPLENFPSNDLVSDATNMNNAIGKIIKQNPSQYWWMHKRFKTRPKGETSVY